LPERRDSASSRLQVGDTGVALRKSGLALRELLAQLGDFGGVGLEEPAKLGDLSD